MQVKRIKTNLQMQKNNLAQYLKQQLFMRTTEGGDYINIWNRGP